MDDTIWYKIKEEDLLNLIYDHLKLEALESYGVDNWPWYSEAIEDYMNEIAETEELSLYDVARRLMKTKYYGTKYD